MQGFGIEDGTPIKLRTARTISSADAHTGDTLDFEVLEDVFASGILVVPKGGIAWGTVTEAEPKRRMGRGGKLNVKDDRGLPVIPVPSRLEGVLLRKAYRLKIAG